MSANRNRRTASLYRGLAIPCAFASLGWAGTTGGCKRCSTETARPAPVPVSIGIAPDRAGYVTNNGSDTLAAIDLDGTKVEMRSLDIDPGAHEAPHHLAVDGKGGVVFVALAFPAPPEEGQGPHKGHGTGSVAGRIVRLDLATLAIKDTREVDPSPGDIVLTRDHAKLLVTHFDMKRAMEAAMEGKPTSEMFATLQVWDARTFERVASRPLCVAPHGVATTADGKTALVACYGSDEIALVDLTSATLATARYPLGSSPGVPGAPRYGPYSVTLDPAGSRAVVANLEGAGLRVFDMATRRFVPEVDVSLGARAFMPAFVDGHEVIVPLQAPDGLARVDVEKGTIVAQVAFEPDVCKNPHVVRVAHDHRVYVVCEGDHAAPGAVVEVDPVTLATKRRWQVGVYPDGLAFGDD